MSKYKLPRLDNCNVAVLGIGYVGLPLALAIAKRRKSFLTQKKISRNVIAFDLNKLRIYELEQGLDRNKIYSKSYLDKIKNIKFTSDENKLKNVDVFIITVPTPLNEKKEPDLSYIKEASRLVGKALKTNQDNIRNQLVIYESTVYPGVTEDICVPILERESDRKYNSPTHEMTFYCGYSPERINPGDTKHTIDSIVKVTSGCNKKVSSWIDNFYGSFIKAGTFKVKSIKVAEAAKIIENTQRDINIALINELSIIFKIININTKEVLNAAETKWNFQKYNPGLVGGHCIGVDPYYLTFIAKRMGYHTKLISAGRDINDYMHQYLFEQILYYLKNQNNVSQNLKALVLGITYKENCPDIRNSQLIHLVNNMNINNMKVSIVDPQVNQKEVYENTGLKVLNYFPKNQKFSIIIFALKHKEFNCITYKALKKFSYEETLIFDLTNNITGDNVIHL